MVSSCFLKFQTPKPKTSWRLAEVIWFVCSSMFQRPYLKCCPIDCYIFGAAQPQTISHMDELILVIYVCWNISWYPLYISMFVDFGWKQFRINMYAWKCGRLTPNSLLYVLGKLLKTKHTKKKTVRSHWNSENMGLFYLVFFLYKKKRNWHGRQDGRFHAGNRTLVEGEPWPSATGGAKGEGWGVQKCVFRA